MSRGIAWFMAAGLMLAVASGCERDPGEEDCLLESAYLCEGGACYCVSDVLRENPMAESIAASACEECTSSGPIRVDVDAASFSEFGGIDHFSGDDDYGTPIDW